MITYHLLMTFSFILVQEYVRAVFSDTHIKYLTMLFKCIHSIASKTQTFSDLKTFKYQAILLTVFHVWNIIISIALVVVFWLFWLISRDWKNICRMMKIVVTYPKKFSDQPCWCRLWFDIATLSRQLWYLKDLFHMHGDLSNSPVRLGLFRFDVCAPSAGCPPNDRVCCLGIPVWLQGVLIFPTNSVTFPNWGMKAVKLSFTDKF